MVKVLSPQEANPSSLPVLTVYRGDLVLYNGSVQLEKGFERKRCEWLGTL